MKEIITLVGGGIAFLNLTWYAWRIWFKKVKPQSPATWLMWTIIDAILFMATIFAHKPIWLPFGYTIGAAAITVALFVRGEWVWSYKETMSAICAFLSMCIWLGFGSAMGILAGALALFFSGLPLIIDLIKNPIRGTFPVWAITVFACILILIGSDWSLAGTALAWQGVIQNGLLSIVALRGK